MTSCVLKYPCWISKGALLIAALLLINGCAGPKKRHHTHRKGSYAYSHPIKGQRHCIRGFKQRGMASWYGKKFHGRRTASGERYSMYQMTAAHKTLPLGSKVRVKNIRTGRSVIVRINDRGPFRRGRVIDLSYVAAKQLGITQRGTGYVEIRSLT